MVIKKIGICIIAVSDMERAIIFYRDIMGLHISYNIPAYMELMTGPESRGTMLIVGLESPEEDFQPGKNAPINFVVDDIQKTKMELEEKGVKFLSDIVELPEKTKLALFEDPDKNKFFLIEEN